MTEQRVRYGVLAVLAALVPACSGVRIPYRFTRASAARQPVHARRVAVVPFKDARAAEDAGHAPLFVYRGVDFVPTDLDEVYRGPRAAITEIVGKHLASAGVFSQIILVDSERDAPEADFILTGQIKRARGYVEANERKPAVEGQKPPETRSVLAEVLLENIEIREAQGDRRVLLRTDVGWSIQEERSAIPEPPAPWVILADALRTSLDQLTDLIANADLSGEYVVRDRVELGLDPVPVKSSTAAMFGQLDREPPAGWLFEAVETKSKPLGWKGKEACAEARLVEQQMMHFHRALGPYRPTVVIWACPGDVRVEYDARVELPAIYIGRRSDGVHYFAHAIGETNWPRALDQIAGHLRLVPPPGRYIFEIGGAD